MSSDASESENRRESPPGAAEAGTYLAPGFRFHPTDEELISYYLKRKVTGRPIRADAISEIDLYRVEPWDLPPRSRLRSRDLEWYFFTSLDRKYSNRSRTNRATAEGYWKTTGKDRPIQRGSRVIGMKKTLVYHAGRAPRGQRTNWVMHEYRLEDDDLARAGILQDGYVLCRVFQKNGSGPQNGAQYGAPFLEEEWEREDADVANLVPANVDRETLIDLAAQDFVQLGDFLQDPESGAQNMNIFPPEETTTSVNLTEDSSIFVEDILDLVSFDGMTEEADFSISHDNNTSPKKNAMEADQSNHASMQSKGYMQLEDSFNGHHDGFNTDTIIDDIPWECPGQLAEDNLIYYDALSHEIPFSQDGPSLETSLLSPLSDFDFSEELLSFYDTTNDNLPYTSPNQLLSQFSPLNSPEWIHPDASMKVVGSSTLSGKTTSPPIEPNAGLTEDDDQHEGCEDKTLTKRLASMLHSIPAPPAYADESGLTGKTAARIAAASGGSLHITAGVIQIGNWTAMGYAESWTLQKHPELRSFGYGVGDDEDDDDGRMVVGKFSGRGSRNKAAGSFFSSFCRGGCHLFLLSVVVVVLGYKIGVNVCHL